MPTPSPTHSKSIHAEVLNEVKALLTHIPKEALNRNLRAAMEKLDATIAPARKDLEDGIKSLQAHAKWDTFTIAFYGETNAGKSTTIDTLRMVLGEETKMQSRQKFREIQVRDGLSATALALLKTQIDHAKSALEQLPQQIDAHKSELEGESNRKSVLVAQMRQKVSILQANASIFQKMLNFFRKGSEENQLLVDEQELANLLAIHAKTRAQLDVQIGQAQSTLEQLHEKFDRSRHALDSLLPWADGHIVGTGRPDFTVETKSYKFHVDGQDFELLDLPGIEGKEAKVRDSILGAVKTAHAVFYVTGKAAAPQTGEPGSPGTLEKIREHLGDQTEVWAIFNKRIKNPMGFRELVTEGEKESLKVLDATMKQQLGELYRGCISISALPAFLMLADCLVPMSELDSNRAKWLKKMTIEDVLNRSGVVDFVRQLTGSMVCDSETRIRAANLKKLTTKVYTAAKTMLTEHRDVLDPLCNGIQDDWSKVRAQLGGDVGMFAKGIRAMGKTEIEKIETLMRQTMYGRIEVGLDNNQVQPVFEECLESESKALEKRVQTKMNHKLKEFATAVTDRLHRFNERASELQSANRKLGSASFGKNLSFNFKFDHGINFGALAASLLGGVAMIWNPGGWILLSLGAVTVVVGVAKAVWGWFDEDFKKNEQRKAVNKNLNQLQESLMDEFKKASAAVVKNITDEVQHLLTEIDESVAQTATISSEVKRIALKLQHLSTSIT